MATTIISKGVDMNIILDKLSRHFINIIFILMVIFSGKELLAEPYISIKTQQPCSACHVNPTGGGMRTTYGNLYGYTQLPATSSEANNFDFAKISDFVRFGGNLRYDFEISDDDSSQPTQSSFNVQSAQIYTLIKAGRDDLMLYLDQQVSPGSALSREAFIIKTFDNGDYLKVGKMMPALGLKIEDDSAFIRQVTGFNFDNSDNGVEYGLTSGSSFYNFYITNGTSSVVNNDNKFQFGVRAEYFLDELRVGGAIVFNDGDEVDKNIFSLFAGYHWNKVTLIGEVDLIEHKNNNGNLEDITELVGLIEFNYEAKPGHNIKLTSEYYDPDDNLSEDQRTRNSLIYEYTPFSNIQLRFGYRDRDAPPQFPQQNLEKLFVQTHFYF